MKSDTKDTTLAILFGVLVVFNILAIGVNIGSCVCSVGDMDCVEACEQRFGINHIICLVVNIISFFAVAILIWVWSKEEKK